MEGILRFEWRGRTVVRLLEFYCTSYCTTWFAYPLTKELTGEQNTKSEQSSPGSIHHVMWSFLLNFGQTCQTLSHHTTSLSLQKSTFGITWCDNFWPNMWLEAAGVFTLGDGCWLSKSCFCKFYEFWRVILEHILFLPWDLAGSEVRLEAGLSPKK